MEPASDSPRETISRDTAITAEDFVLIISAEETTLQQGGRVRIYAELKNNSGEDIVATSSWPVLWPHIRDWHIFEDWDIISIEFDLGHDDFPAYSTMNSSWDIGNTLEPGIHELRVSAMFSLDKQEEQRITVWSNTIVLTLQ